MIEQIFLIGYRASGKTTVGKPLAEKLGLTFLDTDHLIRHKTGCEVADIVASEGWDGFRKYEAEALKEADIGSGKVIATGGGAILHKQFWEHKKDSSFVVWLFAEFETIINRLKFSQGEDLARPSLTGDTLYNEVESVLAERLPLYTKYADVQVDTDRLSTDQVVDAIVEEYRRRCCGSSR